MPTVNPATLTWSGAASQASLVDNLRSLKYDPVEVYDVTCTPDAIDLDIYTATDLPRPGDLYNGLVGTFAKTARATRIAPVLWKVAIEYGGYTGTGAGGLSESPLLTPAILNYDDVETEEEVDEDFDGNPILTEAFEPVRGIKAVFCDRVITIKKNWATFNDYVASAYRRSVNSDTFLGWPPGTAKMMKLSAQQVKDGYFEVTGVIQCRIPYRTTAANAWYARWVHEGFYHKQLIEGGPAFQIVRAQNEGQPTEEKVLLDTNGFRLADGGTTVWKETKLYNSLPFGALGLI